MLAKPLGRPTTTETNPITTIIKTRSARFVEHLCTPLLIVAIGLRWTTFLRRIRMSIFLHTPTTSTQIGMITEAPMTTSQESLTGLVLNQVQGQSSDSY